MGAKTWMLVYSDGDAVKSLQQNPKLDRDKTIQFVKELFPAEKLEPVGNGDLSYTSPPDNTIFAGYYSGVFIIAAKEFGIDYPSKLSPSFLDKKYGTTIHLHAMHSVVDWFAFGLWKDGELQRALSLSPDSEILEDIGQKLSFELPFWNGEHPVFGPEDEEDEHEYPFKFHPLELGESALNNFFGYVLEGEISPEQIEPEDIKLLGFKRSKSWWKLW